MRDAVFDFVLEQEKRLGPMCGRLRSVQRASRGAKRHVRHMFGNQPAKGASADQVSPCASGSSSRNGTTCIVRIGAQRLNV